MKPPSSSMPPLIMPPRGPAQMAAMDAASPPPTDDQAGTVPIPLKALQQPGEDDQMQTPGVGDPVSFQTDATIVSIEGEMAMVKPSAVNGVPVGAAAADDEGPDDGDESGEGADTADDDEESALRGMAGQQ